jgi:tRNA pseudouridine55 synthase
MTHGALVIDKPAGPTSHDVVVVVRRALDEPRIGHTGTLDPTATGVLPLLVGRATRLASLLTATDKAYVAEIRFGAATDTYDAAGIPTEGTEPASGPSLPDRRAVEEALDAFRGTFLQRPPKFSAKKIAGVRAYDLARRQAPVEPAPKRVTVHRLDISSFTDGAAIVFVECSAGFYVRSLAHDLGVRLGCGAHLGALRRVRSGGFTVDQALPLEQVVAEGQAAAEHIIKMQALADWLPAVVVNDEGKKRVSHGRDLCASHCHGPASETAEFTGTVGEDGARSHVRVMDAAGELLAIAESQGQGGPLHPLIVLV